MAQLVGFTYDSLPQGEIDKLKAAAARIKRRVRSSVEDLFQIGQELLDARKLFAGDTDASFMAWVKYEFDMPRNTAWRFMSVAARYYDTRSSLEHLPVTALYELASPSLPVDVRKEVEERVMDGGEVVTATEIQRLRDENAKLADQVVELEAEVDELAIPVVIPVRPDAESLERQYQAFVGHWRALSFELRERFWREYQSPLAVGVPTFQPIGPNTAQVSYTTGTNGNGSAK